MKASPRRRVQGDRGAGMVEYALAAGLLLVVVVAGLQWVQDNGEQALDRQADNIDYTAGGGGTPATTSSTTSSTSSSTTTSSTTTTTAAPSTSTTTVAPPPTTAAPTTTTTTTAPPSPSPSGSGMTSLTVASAKPTISWWNGKDGAWLNGITFDYGWKNGANVSLSITRYLGNGKSETSTTSVYVNSGSSSPYLPPNTMSNSASSNVTSVLITVTAISTQDADWKNQVIAVSGPSVTIQAPRP